MILVTGGTGLLGSHLLLELVREHEEVVAVKRPTSDIREVQRVFSRTSGEAQELFRLIDWVDIDLMNYAEVERLMIDIDQVYHCAGMVSFQRGDARRMREFNLQTTENMVNACLETGGKRLVHVSSSSTIGRAPEGYPANESLIWVRGKSASAYAESKFRSEMEVWRGIEEGLNAVIVNPVIILGSGFWTHGSSVIFHRVARGLMYATTGMTGYVGVQDVVSAMTRLMDTDISRERFILSAADLSYAELMELVAAALGKPRTMKLLSPRSLRNLARMDAFRSVFTGHRTLTSEQAAAAFRQSRFSSDKIADAIGFQFTPIEEVVRQVAGHYLADHPG
jgi:nucleoside-diphosphate-sugar epimerase